MLFEPLQLPFVLFQACSSLGFFSLLRHVLHALLPGRLLLGTDSLIFLLTGMGCRVATNLIHPYLVFRIFESLLAKLCRFGLTALRFILFGFLPRQELFLLSQNVGCGGAVFLNLPVISVAASKRHANYDQ